jgi:hypothetical protein
MTGTLLSEAIWDLVSNLINAAGEFRLTYGGGLIDGIRRWGVKKLQIYTMHKRSSTLPHFAVNAFKRRKELHPIRTALQLQRHLIISQ